MELKGVELDLAVARSEGRRLAPHPSAPGWWLVLDPDSREWHTIMEAPDAMDRKVWSPSCKWGHGGPIIERERIAVTPGVGHPGWTAGYGLDEMGEFEGSSETGPTPLIAAMRAYVASKQR